MTALRVVRGTDPAAEVARLNAENRKLRARLDYMRREIFGDRLQFPPEWRLTPSERRLLGILLSRNIVSREAAIVALYGEPRNEPEWSSKLVDVFLHHLRRKIKSFGVVIVNQPGNGWYVAEPRRAELRRALRMMDDPWSDES